MTEDGTAPWPLTTWGSMVRIAVLCALVWLSGPQLARADDSLDWASSQPSLLAPASSPTDGWASVFTLLPPGPRQGRWSGDDPVVVGRDWGGIATDTAWFLGYQVLLGAFVYALPEGVTDWTSEEKDDLGEQWWKNVSNPHWDSDAIVFNYIVHPYWGAAYYIRARERGFGPVGAFVYSALLSTLFEYGVEALFEPPSFQDLIITPVAGTLLGAFVFEPLRKRIKAKPELSWSDKVIMVATDPLGGLNAVFERLFGIKSEVRLQFRPLTDIQVHRRDALLSTVPRGQGPGQGIPRRPEGLGLGVVVRY
jgi:Domain of unknown function (DUF3943)